MSLLVLKVISTGETRTVTDEEYQAMIVRGDMRFYEVGERIEEVDVPKSVKSAMSQGAPSQPQNGDTKGN